MRQRTLGFFALVLLLVPTAAADWASFHNDALGSGFVKDSKYPVYEDVWWSNKSLANQQVYASPVIKDQVVVTADRGGVVRGLDAESGRELWRHKMTGAVEGTPAIAGERVYVVDVKGVLKALNLRDGRVETTATVSVGPTYGSIREHQGKIFIGNDAGQMKAYFGSTLTLLWTFDVGTVYSDATSTSTGAMQCSAADAVSGPAAREIRGAPAVYGGRVFFGSFNHWVFAIDEEGLGNGKTTLHWIYKTGDIVASSPAIRVVNANSYRVIVGSYDGKLYSFDGAADEGETCNNGAATFAQPSDPLGTYVVPSGNERKIESSPAVAGDKIFFGANNGHVYAVRGDALSPLWDQANTGNELSPITSSPAVANDIVVVGSRDKNVYWLSATDGKILKTFAAQGAIGTSPAIDGDRAYIAATDGTVYMFGPKVPPRPDLVVTAIKASATQVTASVKNVGTKEAEASKLRFLVDGALLADVDVPAIPAGATHNVTFQGTLAAGSRTISATADFGAPDVVKEANEINNNATAVFQIGAPPPPPQNTQATTEDTGTKGKIPFWNVAPLVALIGLAILLRRRIR